MSYQLAMENINKIIHSTFRNYLRKIFVLEAGCGSITRISLPENALVIGLDISIEQLRRSRISRAICGDLHNICFKDGTFDIICCWDVLEHLSKPEIVLRSFFRWIRPGGLIILKVPNPLSFKGIATKLTPLWFHKVWHRFILGSYKIDPGYPGPFKTYMRACINYKIITENSKIDRENDINH